MLIRKISIKRLILHKISVSCFVLQWSRIWNQNTVLCEWRDQAAALTCDAQVAFLQVMEPHFQTGSYLAPFSVDHSSPKTGLPGQLALPWAIWSFHSLTRPITEKFQVLPSPLGNVCCLTRHPSTHLQDDDSPKMCPRNFSNYFKKSYTCVKTTEIRKDPLF